MEEHSRGPGPLFFPHGTLGKHGKQKKEINSTEQGSSSTASSSTTTTTIKAAWAFSVCCGDFPDGHIQAPAVSRPWMYISA